MKPVRPAGSPSAMHFAVPRLFRTIHFLCVVWVVSLGFSSLPGALHAQAVPDVRVISQPDGLLVERHWTARAGLPVTQITGIIRGKDGYLWLSTFDGLVRFDGVRFSLFNKGQSPELPSARFSKILGEWGGKIWLVTEADHLVAFQNGTFRDYTPDLEGRYSALFHDASGDLWVGTEEGLFRFVESAFLRVPLTDEGGVAAIHGDPMGALVLARSSGALQVFDPASSRLTPLLPASESLGRNWALALDETGAVWGAANRGVVRVHPGGVDAFPLEGNWGRPLAISPPGRGRIGVVEMESGAFQLLNGRWERLSAEGLREDILPVELGGDGGRWFLLEENVMRNGRLVSSAEAVVSDLLVDAEGSVWGAGPSGLYQFRQASVEGIPLLDAGERYEAYGLHEGRSGALWVTATGPGVVSGLWRIQGRDVELVIRSPSPDFPFRLEMGVLEDRQGSIWVPLEGGGVCRLTSFRCTEANRFPLDQELVRAIFEARDGTLWFGTVRSLRGLRPDGSWIRFGPGEGLPEVTIRAVAETPEGHLWFGTQRGGLIYWDGDRFEQISLTEGLSSMAVRALHLDSDGALWVGTEGLGISRVGRPRGREDGLARWSISKIRQADGLFDDGIHQILEDPMGRMWMSSNRGLFFVQRAELEAFVSGTLQRVRSVKFDEREGLINRELNGGVHGAGLVTRDGRLIFPGMQGLAVVNPGLLQRDQPAPPVRIEEVRIGGKTVFTGAGAFKLPRGNRDLEVAFTGLSFWTPETIVFRYRLRGLDTEWRESVGLRSAYYTNLSGGRYVFEVLASNEPGVWSDIPETLEVVVPHRSYEHPAMQAGFGLLVLLSLFGMVRLRENQLRSQARQLELLVSERTRVVESQAERLVEMDRMKSRLFEDISHELRTPLTLIVAPLEGVREGLTDSVNASIRRDVDVALQSSRRLLDLVAQILDLARLEAGRLPVRVTALDTAGWIHHQILAFSPLAEQKGVRLRAEIPAHLPDLWSSPDLFQKMLGNLISNAIKFTPDAGVVRVRSWASEDHVVIEVRDSGPGIPPHQMATLFQRFSESFGSADREVSLPSTRIGLSLANQLAELHGGGIEARSEEGFGATFLLKLKLGRDHLPDYVEVDESQRSHPAGSDLLDPSFIRSNATSPMGLLAPEPGVELRADRMGARLPRVLVVEDHPDVRAYLQVLLGGLYRVQAVTHGGEALEYMRKETPDLIVSDLRMPEVDGLELLASVRAQDQERADGLTTPFLLVSAHDDSMDRSMAYRMGASDFMTKPFSPRDLLARIAGLLATQVLLEQRRPVLKVSAGQVAVQSASASFLARLAKVVEDNLSDPEFGASALASALGYSRSGLYRKLEEVGEASPAQLLQRMRLDRASQLLGENAATVSRVAFQCGFRTVSHFSRVFKEQFGVPPSQYVVQASTGTERQTP